MKILFLFIAIFLVWWILRSLRKERITASKPKIKNMLSCKYCGLHIPEDETIRKNGNSYCSKAHAQKDNR